MSHHPEINWKEFIPPTLTAEIEEECGLTLNTPIDEILDSFFEYINSSAIYPINSYSKRSLLAFLVSNNYKEFHTLQKSKSNIPNRLKSWVREMLSLFNCQDYTLSFYKWRLKKKFQQDFYSIIARYYKDHIIGEEENKDDLKELKFQVIYFIKSLESFISLPCFDTRRHKFQVKVVDEEALTKYVKNNFEPEFLDSLWNKLQSLRIKQDSFDTYAYLVDFLYLVSKAKVYIRFLYSAKEKLLLEDEYFNHQKVSVTREVIHNFTTE